MKAPLERILRVVRLIVDAALGQVDSQALVVSYLFDARTILTLVE